MSNDTASLRLRGAQNLKARKIYRALLKHCKQDSCLICDRYPQYGSMIVRGDFFQHIGDVACLSFEPVDFFKLTDAGLIELDQITSQKHRIVFTELEEEEEQTA